jgi:hypothetical protein
MASRINELVERRTMVDRIASVGSAEVSYVLPILCGRAGSDMDDLTGYLRWVSTRAELVIVDGSQHEIFRRNHALWGRLGTHIRPDEKDRCLNGKAWGVMTGVRRARRESVIIADDDVRFDARAMDDIARSLRRADLVRPQNYFDPLPWHAAWDTGRTLINRSLRSDHPGTVGVRRSTFLGAGGYDGDVLFENLEMVRTIEAVGGSVLDRPDVFVRRIPPTVERFWSQRVRQAYDDFSQPWRLATFLTVLPAIVAAIGRRRARPVLLGAAAVIALAERGRRRHGGAAVFPARCTWFAPAWVLERGTCAWVALWHRSRGGIRYAGNTITIAATPARTLRAHGLGGRFPR